MNTIEDQIIKELAFGDTSKTVEDCLGEFAEENGYDLEDVKAEIKRTNPLIKTWSF
ncbi:hypothetical protein H8D85_01840 [bacterium]|nr:hypothetical protein [bacterium]